MTDPINVGVIGYGYAARLLHIPFIINNPDLRLAAIVQRGDPKIHGKPASSCEDDFPDVKRYRSADELFDDETIQLVVVGTQVGSHAEYAERALRSGKHVIVEKPFVGSTEVAEKVMAVQRETGKVLTVFQNRQYDSDFRTLKHLVKTGAFGKIRECEFHYDWNWPPMGVNAPPYQPGEGLLFGLGTHTLDQAIILFGPPSSVTGFYRPILPDGTKTDWWFTVILQYDGDQSDLVVTVKTNIETKLLHQPKYFVRGSEATYIKYGADPQEDQLASGMSVADARYGFEPEATYGTLTSVKQIDPSQKSLSDSLWEGKYPSLQGDWKDYWTDVVAAIRGEQQVVVDPVQSTEGLRIIELARKSAEEGRTIPYQ